MSCGIFKEAGFIDKISSTGTERKRCNQLDGKTWTRHSISIWSDLKKSPEELRHNHPAAFPLALAERCIEIFTAGPGELVCDPFAGSGTTLIAAYNLERRGLGIELYEHYQALFRERLAKEGRAESSGSEPILIAGDARSLDRYVEAESVDFILTSPPYWDILLARRSADRRRQRDYGVSSTDLGRTEDYHAFIGELQGIFALAAKALKPGRHCAVVVMDLRKKSRFYPLHMDLAAALAQTGLVLDDIIIWDRRHDYNRLRPLGYPSVFRVNKVHEYLLIFQKPK